MEALRKQGRQPRLPEVGGAYLLDILMDVGPTQPGAMGPVPLTHSEILAYQVNMNTKLSPREVRLLRQASMAYVQFLNEAEDAMCPQPFDAPLTDWDRQGISRSLQADLDRLQ